MATNLGDVLIDAKPYSLTIGGYSIYESIRTRPAPASQPRSLSTFEHQNNWQYFGQSNWAGMNFPKYEGDVGTFKDGYGFIIGTEGELQIADQLVLDKADATNPDGYVAFRIGYPVGDPSYGHNRSVFIGKTNGTAFSRDGLSGVWTTTLNSLGAGVKAVSKGFFASTTFVGASNGHVFDTADGVVFNDHGTPGPTSSAYILGDFLGFMYVGYDDGSVWKVDRAGGFSVLVPASTLAANARCGAGGGNVFYIITQGPAPQVLFTDGQNLYQATIIGTDFEPRAAVFLGKLFIFGEQSFDVAPKGACWVLGANGITEDLTFGNGQVDQGIKTAQVEGELILWAATGNAALGKSGIGIFDPRLDVSPDAPLGYFVAHTTDYAAGKRVHGISEVYGLRFCGIEGVGIYKTTTPGAFKLISGLYGAEQRNIQKRWGSAEVRHTTLANGQVVTVKTTKNPADAEDLWGNSSDTDGVTPIPAPAGYKTPFLSYVLAGTANGSDLTIYDVALAYLRVPDVVKKEWVLNIAVEGHNQTHGNLTSGNRQYDRSGTEDTRTSMDMIADLNALWNKTVVFEDVDGTSHTVIVRGVDARLGAGHKGSGEIDRTVSGGAVVNLSMPYTLHLIEV